MLTHIVVWKYKEEVAAETRQQHVAGLRALVSAIPEIEELQVGADVLHLARSYDTGLVARFRDRTALDAYDAHPQHQKIALMGRGISAHVASVDFET